MATWLLTAVVCTLAGTAHAQPKDTIYDEAKVPDYVLPDPLVMQDGTKVADAETWKHKRRPEVLRLFEEHVHGRSSVRPERIAFDVTSVDEGALVFYSTWSDLESMGWIVKSLISEQPSMDLAIQASTALMVVEAVGERLVAGEAAGTPPE